MLYEVFGPNAMATKLWKELQISLSIKVRGAHPGAEGGTWGTIEIRLLCFVSLALALLVFNTHVSVDIKSQFNKDSALFLLLMLLLFFAL